MTKEQQRIYAREWRRANPEKIKAYQKKYNDTNREKVRARGSAWKRNHRKQVSAREKLRKKEDLNFSIKKRLKSRVWHSVNRQSGKKAKVTMELLGCSIPVFRQQIEAKFKPGMTWENIHLDHIMPCSLFDLTDPEQQRRCFHFTNYRPLFAIENIIRGNKMTLADWAMLT